MKLTITTFVSLDGVMQAPGGPEEDTSGGFDLGGWTFPHFDADAGLLINEWFGAADAFLLGRRTYDIFASYWPAHDDPANAVAHGLNTKPKYVASTTLTDPAWGPVTVLAGDVPAAVAELKAQPGGELQVHGSGGLAQTLIEHGLVDEFRLLTFPVVLGKGRRLFGDGARPAGLRLTDSRTTSTGVLIAVYEATGAPPERGSFAD